METRLGRFPAQTELPDPLKFAWPILVLPELFTTARHLATLVGYFSTMGWEIFAPDLHAVIGQDGVPPVEMVPSAEIEPVGSWGEAQVTRWIACISSWSF